VSSRNKKERKDAITGLARIYAKKFVEPQLKAVVDGGEDCEIEVVVKTLHEMCHLEHSRSKRGKRRHHEAAEWSDVSEERYGWIPANAWKCACYSDAVDPEMRTRVYQILDELLFGKLKDGTPALTPTAQAIALTAMIDSLVEGGAHSLLTGNSVPSDAFKFLQQLLSQRAQLQKAVSSYIDARAEMRNYEAGT